MKFFKYLLAVSAMLVISNPAFAGVFYTASATTSDSSPLTAVTPGAQISIEITMLTDDFAFGNAGSVNNYDNSIVQLDTAASFIGTAGQNIFAGVCYAPGACFNGLPNGKDNSNFAEVTGTGPGVEAEFFSGVSLIAAQGDGSLDQGEDLVSGGPQFKIVFNAIGAAGSSTTINIGTYLEYQDAYSGSVDGNENNTSVTITVPEPTAIATSLAAFTSVFGVIAIRRRML